jgi:hypothetical protein
MSSRFLRALGGATLATLLAAGAAPALAQSTTLTDWTVLGDAVFGAGSVTLSTAATESGEQPLSGQSALFYDALEGALGVSLGADAWEGSALATSFVAAAGTTVSWHWSLASEGYDADFADRAFVLVDGQTLITLGDVASGPAAGSYSITFDAAGSHALAFGVVDVNDVAVVSTLTVDGLSVSAVPEPATTALWLAGLAAVGAVGARRRAAQRSE